MIRERVGIIALAAALCATAPAAQARWYMGHVGAENCVPLDDFDPDTPSGRVYYGTGPFHEPADFADAMVELGVNMTLVPTGTEHGVEYRDDKGTEYVFFDSPGLCQAFMEVVKGRR